MRLPSCTLEDGFRESPSAETLGRERGYICWRASWLRARAETTALQDLIGLYGYNFCGPHGGVGFSPLGVGACGCGPRVSRRSGGRERWRALGGIALVKNGGHGGAAIKAGAGGCWQASMQGRG